MIQKLINFFNKNEVKEEKKVWLSFWAKRIEKTKRVDKPRDN